MPWAPLAAEAGGLGRWPLPAALRSVPSLSYVGRELDERAIEEERAAVREGARRVVLIAGEPGIGKSRLAAYAAHGAHAEGLRGLLGRVLGGARRALRAVDRGLLSSSSSPPRTEALERHVERHGGELSRLARNLARRVPDAARAAVLRSGDRAISAVLGGRGAGRAVVAEQVPLCLVLDDCTGRWSVRRAAQACDRGRSRTGTFALIATYRDSDLGKDHALTGVLADLRRIEGVRADLAARSGRRLRWRRCSPRSPATSSTERGWSWRGRSPRRPTAIRSSSARSSAACRSPGRSCWTERRGAGGSSARRRCAAAERARCHRAAGGSPR